jgi:hypothetical protein
MILTGNPFADQSRMSYVFLADVIKMCDSYHRTDAPMVFGSLRIAVIIPRSLIFELIGNFRGQASTTANPSEPIFASASAKISGVQ